ncbi:MAG: DUF1858 domain-containing protein [Sphaerochaetaceae bacterium]|jgi:hypothetical protein
MDKKYINLNESVNALCTQYPELVSILANLGFTEIVKPLMLNTVGKLMTLPKGAAMRNIDLEQVMQSLREHGYYIEEDIYVSNK